MCSENMLLVKLLQIGAKDLTVYFTIFKEIFNLEGHPNCITDSKVMATLLNGLILPIGGASAVKGLRLQPAQQACYSIN